MRLYTLAMTDYARKLRFIELTNISADKTVQIPLEAVGPLRSHA